MTAAAGPADALLSRIARAISPLVAAAMFAIAWLEPARLAQPTIHSLRATMVVEFLAIHSGMFMTVLLLRAAKPGKATTSVLMMLPLLAIYLVSAFGLSRQVHAWWPLVAAAFLLGGRVAPRFIADPARRDAATWRAFAEWGCGFAVFMATAAFVQHGALPLHGLATLDPADYPIVGWKSSLTMPQELQWGALHFALLAALNALLPYERMGAFLKDHSKT
jgi:hypothetical protein